MAQCFWHNGMASASELEGLSSIPTSSSDRQNAMPPTFFFGEKEASCDKWFNVATVKSEVEQDLQGTQVVRFLPSYFIDERRLAFFAVFISNA